MKVLLINGSPHKERGTFTALSEVANALETHNIESEITWIGSSPVLGCQACGACAKSGSQRCIFRDDIVNTFIEKAQAADGLVVGTPVHYAGAGGALLATLDRMFYAAGSSFAFKPAAGIACARRAGTTPAIDQVNKYFQISQMPVVSSNYWPMVHGNGVEEVRQDLEGMQIMRVLGHNMAWMLELIQKGKEAGISTPPTEGKIFTNFIR